MDLSWYHFVSFAAFIIPLLTGIAIFIFFIWMGDRAAKSAGITSAFLVFSVVLFAQTVEIDIRKKYVQSMLKAQDEVHQFPLFLRQDFQELHDFVIKKPISGNLWSDLGIYRSIKAGNWAGSKGSSHRMTVDQHNIFSQYIESCFPAEAVADIWQNRVPGYPITPSEARYAIEYAQARSEVLDVRCVSATTLSFLAR